MTESELFLLLLKKPDLYVEHTSVNNIHAFLNGYRDTVKMKPDLIYRGFGKWLRKRLRITQDVNWLPIICFFGQGETDTLDLAREMWAIYQKEVQCNDMQESNEINKIAVTPLGTLKPSELIDFIFVQPAMYLGYKSVSLMHSYMDGFIYGKKIESLQIEDPFYYGFQDWINKRFGFDYSSPWDSVISLIGKTEENSFDLAKELWEEYKAEMKKA